MTPTQRRLARHALGLPNERGVSYRNRYAAARGTPPCIGWDALVKSGHAEFIARQPVANHYALTRIGAELALDPGEALDEEDFS